MNEKDVMIFLLFLVKIGQKLCLYSINIYMFEIVDIKRQFCKLLTYVTCFVSLQRLDL